MPSEIFINIADITIMVKSKGAPIEEEANCFRYKNFILKSRPPKIDIDLSLKVIPKFKPYKIRELFRTERGGLTGVIDGKRLNVSHTKIPATIDIGNLSNKLSKEEERYLGPGLDWRIGQHGNCILIEGKNSSKFQLLISKDLSRGEAFIINAEERWRLTDVIYGFLQVLMIYYLAQKRCGAIFHSAGLHDGKKGFLFAGLSGAGKSTTSRIWDKMPDVNILNDDRVIVRKIDNGFYMYPTPWHGDYSEYLDDKMPKRATLSKLFYIYHRKTNLAERVNYIEGFNQFFKTLFLSFWDKDCVKFAFDFLVDILAQKPCYKFGFKNNSRIISYIRNMDN